MARPLEEARRQPVRDTDPLDVPEDAPVVLDAEDREVLRERVMEALGHEPTDEEMAEWLRTHVEGY